VSLGSKPVRATSQSCHDSTKKRHLTGKPFIYQVIARLKTKVSGKFQIWFGSLFSWKVQGQYLGGQAIPPTRRNWAKAVHRNKSVALFLPLTELR
jgi:hypothetical protein